MKTIVLLVIVWLVLAGQVWGVECMTSDKKGVSGKLTVSNYVQVGTKWWYNWQHWNPSDFNNQVELVPMVRLCKNQTYCLFYDRQNNRVRQESGELIQQVVAKRGGGGYWLLGNEPEVPGQDEVYDPVATARMYRELVDFVKTHDPGAKFIVGGWAGPEDSKRNWPLLLKRKWSEYGVGGGDLCSSIAGWHFHHYAWPAELETEAALAGWKQETDSFAGYLLELCPGKEVWLTEFGSLSMDRNDAAAVTKLASGMKWMVNWLETNNKISRYAWFYAVDGPVYEPRLPGLFTSSSGQMTVLGQTYAGLGRESCVVAPTATLTPTSIPENCPKRNKGDADCDGQVSLVDASIWREEYIDEAAIRADFDGDGAVDLVDRSIWRENYVIEQSGG